MRGFGTGARGRLGDVMLRIAPIACSFFAFLLMAIALSSGMKPNYLEGVAVIRFNTSSLGKSLLETSDLSQAAKDDCITAGSAVPSSSGTVTNGIGQVAALLGGGSPQRQISDSILNKAADLVAGTARDACRANQALHLTRDATPSQAAATISIATAIGISEYYSVHLGALCEGDYYRAPNDAAGDPDVQSCTPKFHPRDTDLAATLDGQLQAGPFQLALRDLDLAPDARAALALIPRALAAMSFILLFATLAVAAGFALSAAAVVAESVMRARAPPLMMMMLLLGALGATGFGWLLSFVGVVGTTAVAEKVKRTVNGGASASGMAAATSSALYFLLWMSLVLTTAALALLFCVYRRARDDDGRSRMQVAREPYAEKNVSAASTVQEDANGFYEEPINGGPAEPVSGRP